MRTLKTILFITILTVLMTSFKIQERDNNKDKSRNEIEIDNSLMVFAKGGFVNEFDGPN